MAVEKVAVHFFEELSQVSKILNPRVAPSSLRNAIKYIVYKRSQAHKCATIYNYN